MKKIICAVLVLALMLLVGCSSGVSQEDYDKLAQELEDLKGQAQQSSDTSVTAELDEPSNSDGLEFHEEEIMDQLIVQEYSYTSAIDTPWHFVVVENTSAFDLDLTCELKTFNAAGDIIAAKKHSQEAVASGTKTIFDFMLDEPYSNRSYELSAEEEDTYKCVTQDIDYESNSAKEKEIITVTNNGTLPAEFLKGYVLFFNGDSLVDYSTTYFIDDDTNALEPGDSMTKEIRCYNDYDSFLIFFTGRCDPDNIESIESGSINNQSSESIDDSSNDGGVGLAQTFLKNYYENDDIGYDATVAYDKESDSFIIEMTMDGLEASLKSTDQEVLNQISESIRSQSTSVKELIQSTPFDCESNVIFRLVGDVSQDNIFCEAKNGEMISNSLQ